MSEHTPSTDELALHRRLVAYVEGQPYETQRDRIASAAAALRCSPSAVYKWIFGERSLPPMLDLAMDGLGIPKAMPPAADSTA